MSKNSTEDRNALDRLTEAMADDVLNTPHDRLLAEVAEDYGNSRVLADEFDNAVARARRKLAWIIFKRTIARLVEVCGLGLFANPVAPITELQPARSQNWAWNSRPAWAAVATVLVVIIAAPIIYFSYEHYIDAQRHLPAAQVKFDPNSVTALLDKRPNAPDIHPDTSGPSQFTIANFDKEIQRDPTNASAFYVRGLYYADTGKYDAAIQDLSEAIQLDPKNAANFTSRGVIYSMELKWDHALKDFNEAVRLDPQYVMWAASRAERITATQYETRVLAAYSERTQLLKIAVALANRDNDGSGASINADSRTISLFKEALRLHSKFNDIYRSRGRAYFFAKDYGAAAADFEHLLQQQPDDAYAMLWLYLARVRATARMFSANAKLNPDCPPESMASFQSVNRNVIITYCNRDALAEMKTNATKLNQADWPYPIVEAYLARRSPEATIGAATNAVERCEAQLYVGEWQLLHDNRTAATDTLKAAADSCPKNLIEFAAIQTELKSLIASPTMAPTKDRAEVVKLYCITKLYENGEPQFATIDSRKFDFDSQTFNDRPMAMTTENNIVSWKHSGPEGTTSGTLNKSNWDYSSTTVRPDGKRYQHIGVCSLSCNLFDTLPLLGRRTAYVLNCR